MWLQRLRVLQGKSGKLCSEVEEFAVSTGYSNCYMQQALNAYELERHAGCKTKHPNNHIYFENGKTVYAVAQELKSTPQEMLFEVIQNVTGSPLNQTNFRIWKGDFICSVLISVPSIKMILFVTIFSM